MNDMEEKPIQCPYCWEHFSVLIDCSVPEQRYVEDCQVCCCPIELEVLVEEGEDIQVSAARGND